MKILKWVSVEQEIEINVTATDFVQALGDDPKRAETVLEGMNKTAVFLRGIPDSVIEMLNAAQRKTIGNFLAEEAHRYLSAQEMTTHGKEIVNG